MISISLPFIHIFSLENKGKENVKQGGGGVCGTPDCEVQGIATYLFSSSDKIPAETLGTVYSASKKAIYSRDMGGRGRTAMGELGSTI